LLSVLALLVAACGDSKGDPTPTATLSPAISTTVTVSDIDSSEVVRVEFAATPLERQTGLMHRESMDDDAGMLFLFPGDTTTGFWMKDTLIPLDIAHVAADGTVLEVNTRDPLDETVLAPRQPYRYTLEVNGGWFERHGLGAGAKVTLPENLPVAE